MIPFSYFFHSFYCCLSLHYFMFHVLMLLYFIMFVTAIHASVLGSFVAVYSISSLFPPPTHPTHSCSKYLSQTLSFCHSHDQKPAVTLLPLEKIQNLQPALGLLTIALLISTYYVHFFLLWHLHNIYALSLT